MPNFSFNKMNPYIKAFYKVLLINLLLVITVGIGLATVDAIERQYSNNISDGKGPRTENGESLLCWGPDGANYCNLIELLEDAIFGIAIFTIASFVVIGSGYPYATANYIVMAFLLFFFIRKEYKKKKEKQDTSYYSA